MRENIFFRVDHVPALAAIFVTRMLTRDLFAAADLVHTRSQEVVHICLEMFDCIGGRVFF